MVDHSSNRKLLETRPRHGLRRAPIGDCRRNPARRLPRAARARPFRGVRAVAGQRTARRRRWAVARRATSGSSRSSPASRTCASTPSGRSTATFCDRLFFAVAPIPARGPSRRHRPDPRRSLRRRDLVREPPEERLAAARRKAMTLRFARAAALRLQASLDPRLAGSRSEVYFGARLARMRCSVRRCMLSRRAVSETLRLHSS